jgi:hypothetical protein
MTTTEMRRGLLSFVLDLRRPAECFFNQPSNFYQFGEKMSKKIDDLSVFSSGFSVRLSRLFPLFLLNQHR